MPEYKQPRVITVEFQTLPYGELRSNYHRSNFWGKRKEVSAIAREEAFHAAPKVNTPVVRCEVEEVFIIPTRRRVDIEGLMGAVKPWIDGIVDSGLLEEDDWKHIIKLSGRVEYRKGQEGTRIIISEILPGVNSESAGLAGGAL